MNAIPGMSEILLLAISEQMPGPEPVGLCSETGKRSSFWFEVPLARILSRLAPSDEPHHALEQAIKSQPESDEAWLLAAGAKQRENGLHAAISWLEHCARENPGLGAPRRAVEALRSGAGPNAAWDRADKLRQSGK